MRNPNSSLARLLFIYYGLIQVAHITALARAGLELITTGTIGFPAPPPPGGWSSQTSHFLIITGGIDGVNVVASLIFVCGYFIRARWRWWLGTVTLTVVAYSAIIFAYGTIASGAWEHHPTAYLSIAVLFLPVSLLTILYGIWAATGKLEPCS